MIKCQQVTESLFSTESISASDIVSDVDIEMGTVVGSEEIKE